MKELKQPWVNWNSMAARIRDTALAPDDPLRHEPLWTGRSGGEAFETEVVRPGIRRWNDARFKRLSESGRLMRLPEFMRQVLDTSTVNLTSSTTSNARLATAQSVPLPLTFFINSDALVNVIGLEPNINPPQVSAEVYRAVLQKFDVALTDGNHRFPGDTNFVFVVPEPAFEDVLVIETLLSLGVMSRKMAASLVMVDFPNAVFSPRRAALLHLFPSPLPSRIRRISSAPSLTTCSRPWRRALPATRSAPCSTTWRLHQTSGKRTSHVGLRHSFRRSRHNSPMSICLPKSLNSPSPAAANSASVRLPSSASRSP